VKIKLKGYIIDQLNVRKLLGVIHKKPLYVPANIFQTTNDFVGQERALEKVLHAQGIKKESLTISNLEAVKGFLEHKSHIDFDENLIKPKILKHDFLGATLSNANKIRDQLRHIGGDSKEITTDMLSSDMEELKAKCDSHIMEIDYIRGNKARAKAIADMKENRWQKYNHSSSVKRTDFESPYTYTPHQAKEEIKRLTQMKDDFERFIKQYPRSISIKDSYTRYRFFAEEIIKSLQGRANETDFIDDMVDSNAEELDRLDFIRDNEKVEKAKEKMFQMYNHTGNPRVKDFVDSPEEITVDSIDYLAEAELQAQKIRKNLRHLDMIEEDVEEKMLKELEGKLVEELEQELQDLKDLKEDDDVIEVQEEEVEVDSLSIPGAFDKKKYGEKPTITKAQKKLVEQIHGKGDFYEVDDNLYFKPKDKDTTFRVDFNEMGGII